MIEGEIKYNGGKIGIIVGRYNHDITGALLKGALHGLAKYGVVVSTNLGENSFNTKDVVKVVRVPGAFEIPLTAQKLFRNGCDVIITLGVIVKGDTDHYTYVCKEVADGIMRVQLDEGKPVIFEVLMVEDIKFAEERSIVPVDINGNILEESAKWLKNKGYIAALNAIEMIELYGKMNIGDSCHSGSNMKNS